MATKTIVLVRHGQYFKAEKGRAEQLTPLGRKQAKHAARRLREYQIDRMVHSTMPRARETAAIIRKELRYRSGFKACSFLRECVPGFPKPLRKKYGHTDVGKLNRHRAQAERAFKKYFAPRPKRDSVEVLVCHGNLIRYLLCRALGIDTLAWHRMDILQCGISVVEIRSTGSNRRRVLSHNDVGHIPKGDRTFI